MPKQGVVDGRGGEHVAAMPDEQFTVNLKATFDDYTDGSEAHYIFVEKKYVHSPAILAKALRW